MDSRFAKKLTYPEFTTHHSIMLNRSPGESEVPPAGSIYQWETVADDTVYINVKFSDGTIQSYPLDPQANTWEPPDSHVAVEDQMEFSPNDISEGVLTLPNNQSIADIGLYTDGTKAERTIISLPVVVTADATRIDFTGIDPEDYAYGGIIRFSRGIVYLYDEERDPQTYYAEEWITDRYGLNKKQDKLARVSGKFRRKTIDRKDYLFNKFNTALNAQ